MRILCFIAKVLLICVSLSFTKIAQAKRYIKLTEKSKTDDNITKKNYLGSLSVLCKSTIAIFYFNFKDH